MVPVFGVSSFVVLTGASRGIGKAIALKLAENVGDCSSFLLTARNEGNLSKTAASIRESAKSAGKNLEVTCVPADLSKDSGNTSVASQLEKIDVKKYKHFLLILNAGSLGDVSRYAHQFTDMSELRDFFQFNVSSMIALTSSFMKAFPPDESRRITIIQITSVLSIQSMKGTSLYCTSKAARDMYMKVLAEEQKDRVRVLSYSPGPVRTDMAREIAERIVDPDSKKIFQDLQNNLLEPEHTSQVLVQILAEDTYESGAHIDIFDVEKEK